MVSEMEVRNVRARASLFIHPAGRIFNRSTLESMEPYVHDAVLDMQIARDALDGLNGYIYWLLDQAAKRAKENGRQTVRAHDFAIM